MTRDADSDAILARRALLLSTALAGVFVGACSGNPDAQTDPSNTIVVPPPGSASATTVGSSIERKGSTRVPFSEVIKNAPPLTASAALNPAERQQLEEQAKMFAPLYEKLERLWENAPVDCPLSKETCQPEWERTIKGLEEITPSLEGPLCGWGAQQKNGYIARDASHKHFLHRTITALKTELQQAAERSGARARFEEMNKARVIMMPCLSCMAPSPRIEETLPFAAEDATISSAAQQALERIKGMLVGTPNLVVEVRGHVDPLEKTDATALARARAEAVYDWLVRNGVPSKRMNVVVMGSNLPIDSSATPEGRAVNRRVDFQSL